MHEEQRRSQRRQGEYEILSPSNVYLYLLVYKFEVQNANSCLFQVGLCKKVEMNEIKCGKFRFCVIYGISNERSFKCVVTSQCKKLNVRSGTIYVRNIVYYITSRKQQSSQNEDEKNQKKTKKSRTHCRTPRQSNLEMLHKTIINDNF